jgi:hypothetical protein
MAPPVLTSSLKWGENPSHLFASWDKFSDTRWAEGLASSNAGLDIMEKTVSLSWIEPRSFDTTAWDLVVSESDS